jgi:hypothetical protein
LLLRAARTGCDGPCAERGGKGAVTGLEGLRVGYNSDSSTSLLSLASVTWNVSLRCLSDGAALKPLLSNEALAFLHPTCSWLKLDMRNRSSSESRRIGLVRGECCPLRVFE